MSKIPHKITGYLRPVTLSSNPGEYTSFHNRIVLASKDQTDSTVLAVIPSGTDHRITRELEKRWNAYEELLATLTHVQSVLGAGPDPYLPTGVIKPLRNIVRNTLSKYGEAAS